MVSILKPVAGADDELRENLESFAALDYPAYELLIGLASPDDPARPIVEALPRGAPRRCGRTSCGRPRRTAPSTTPRSRSSST